MTWNTVYNGPLDIPVTSNPATPRSELQRQLEPFIISSSTAFPNVQSWNSNSLTKYRVLTCCWLFFANGLNDSALGALIPLIEAHYHISYAIVSLIFVSQALGFLLAAPFSHSLATKLGYAKVYILSQLCMAASYGIIISTPPYPVVVIVNCIIGWSIALNLALNNVYCANLAQSTVILGAAHGAYGVGGVVGPITATTLTVSQGWIWSRYYVLILACCLIGAVAAGWFFRGYENENVNENESAVGEGLSPTPGMTTNSQRQGDAKVLVRALRFSATTIGAVFTFVYQGAEVAISGWTISFLLTERHGDLAHVGYVTAGFWGGITLGRFTLSPLAAHFGERPTVMVLSFLAISFQLLVWFVPNIIGDSIAVALVGFVLGPLAPCSMAVFARLLPRSIQTTSLCFVSSAGSSGGAIWPFLTGLLAQSKGTYVLHPICLGLFGVMAGSWWILPKVNKRRE